MEIAVLKDIDGLLFLEERTRVEDRLQCLTALRHTTGLVSRLATVLTGGCPGIAVV